MKQAPKIDDERRQFERHNTRAQGTLITAETNWPVFVINLSYSGALIAILDNHQLEEEESITLHLELEHAGRVIAHGRVAHLKEHYVGLEFSGHGDTDREKLRKVIEFVAQRNEAHNAEAP